MDDALNLAKMEAVLFVSGRPVSLGKLAGFLQIEETLVEEIVRELEASLEERDRGLMLLRNGDEVQLATKPSVKSAVGRSVKEELGGTLTQASLEVLVLIAYGQPIQRYSIDYIRGVDSSFTIRNLMVRGLVDRVWDNKTKTYLYRTTADFLGYLGLAKIEKLPDYGKHRDIFSQTYENKHNAEV